MKGSKQIRLLLILAAVLVLTAVFAVFTVLAFPSLLLERSGDFLILVSAFFASLVLAVGGVMILFVQYCQQFYDLPLEEAQKLVYRLLFGLPTQPPLKPILRVFEGHTDPDGPNAVLKVGGPGFLSVAHDSAAVTSRFGKLHRVLGPGFHTLEPFEKVWDTVDLRPQRRRIKVEFMTRDGIPAYCEADIRFRIYANETPTEEELFPFAEEAVLKVTTLGKRVRGREGSNRIQDWTQRISGGALDGIIRNLLEQYRLDEFLNPRYNVGLTAESAFQDNGGESQEPSAEVLHIAELEKQIEDAVREGNKGIGIKVEKVQLGPVLPSEEAISRQWLEFWQAKLQSTISDYEIEGDAQYSKKVEQAYLAAQVELVTSMLAEVQELTRKGMEVPPQLVLMSFIDVMHSLSERESDVQSKMFEPVSYTHLRAHET